MLATSPETIRLETREADGLIELLCSSLVVLWKDWSRPMICNVLNINANTFTLRGRCPHANCNSNSVFVIVAGPHVEQQSDGGNLLCAAMQCQGCQKYILGIVRRPPSSATLNYKQHYPLGLPDDSVDKAVPPTIAADFSEALRCLWVKAYKATVAMSRRSVEASCNDLGAAGRNLKERIDDLATKGRITEPLKEMAHRVRLTANRELHGKQDDLDAFSETDAIGIVAFVREYFHHVYVMPALLVSYGQPKSQDEPTSGGDSQV